MLVYMKDFYKYIEISDFSGRFRQNSGCVVTVGGFDGVHLGHRSLLNILSDESKKHGVPAAVFSFHVSDHSRRGTGYLAQHDEKQKLLAKAGVDVSFSAPFSRFKDISASEFALDVLFGFMGAKSIVCGHDFRFGKDRAGDAELLSSLLSEKGVNIISVPPLESDNTIVSSTVIRNLISEGNIKQANLLLGRRYSFTAEVIHGAQLGRSWGFPTANQVFPAELSVPKFGVYAVKCFMDEIEYNGIANIGVKPTVGGTDVPLCETNIFGFNGDCYGKIMRVEFVEFIRAERVFPSFNALREQIGIDSEKAHSILTQGVYD